MAAVTVFCPARGIDGEISLLLDVDGRKMLAAHPGTPINPPSEHFMQRWRMRAMALIVFALVATAAIFQCTHSRPGMSTTLEEKVEVDDCAPILHDVDFFTEQPQYLVIPIESAEQCRSRCNRDQRCGVWTWRKRVALGKAGIHNVCYLKTLGKDENPQPQEIPSVASGFACRVLDTNPTIGQTTTTLTTTTTVPTEESLNAHYTCRAIEDNIDYWTQSSLYNLFPIMSAEDCRAKCMGIPGCGAWTWGKIRNVEGLSDTCFLKRLAMGEHVRKHWNHDVVSGSICSGRTHYPEGHKQLTHCDPIEDNTDFSLPNLYSVTPIANEDHCRMLCQQQSKCAVWTFGKADNTDGISNVCFLKVLGHGDKIQRHFAKGVVSGAACQLPKGSFPGSIAENLRSSVAKTIEFNSARRGDDLQ